LFKVVVDLFTLNGAMVAFLLEREIKMMYSFGAPSSNPYFMLFFIGATRVAPFTDELKTASFDDYKVSWLAWTWRT
jgi:hypothetical protein